MLLIGIFILIACAQDPTPGTWPSKFYSWMITTVIPPGSPPSFNQGQMIVYDSEKGFASRFGQQNLMRASPLRPVDYCSRTMHYAIHDGSGDTPYAKVNCTRKTPYTFPVMEWPSEFLVQSRFMGVDPVNRKMCNHFYAPGVTVDGKDKQVDVWTSKDDGTMCQIAMRDLETNVIVNIAFDGFQAGYPASALQCTTALIKCAQEDWVCSAKRSASNSTVLNALKWVCSNGKVNCGPINRGGEHFYPDTLQAHADWAFNEYYQRNKFPAGASSCDFGGSAELTSPPTPAEVNRPHLRTHQAARKINALEALHELNLLCDA